jgi:hypothetical protein
MVIVLACERFMALSHSWSTTYLVIFSKIFAPLRAERRDLLVGIPALIFLLCLGLGILIAKTTQIADLGVLTWGGSLYYLYIAIFMVGHFWHFGRQDFGVLSAYRQRKQQFGKLERLVDLRFAQVMMYVIQPIMYVFIFTHSAFTNIAVSVIPVDWVSRLADTAAVVSVVLFLAVVAFELKKENRSWPKLIYYTVMLFHPMLLYAGRFSFLWYLSYLWSHWLIATSLSLRVNTGFQTSHGIQKWRAVANHVLVVAGVCSLVWLITEPFTGLSILAKDYVDAHEILRTLPPDRYLLVGLFFGFGLGEQLVHYYCDSWLFRFQDPAVRAAVAPHFLQMQSRDAHPSD